MRDNGSGGTVHGEASLGGAVVCEVSLGVTRLAGTRVFFELTYTATHCRQISVWTGNMH
jgi:hypothetical protein